MILRHDNFLPGLREDWAFSAVKNFQNLLIAEIADNNPKGAATSTTLLQRIRST